MTGALAINLPVEAGDAAHLTQILTRLLAVAVRVDALCRRAARVSAVQATCLDRQIVRCSLTLDDLHGQALSRGAVIGAEYRVGTQGHEGYVLSLTPQGVEFRPYLRVSGR